MNEGPIRTVGDDVMVDVWVVPRARRSEVAGVYDGALRIRVAAPPADGKANTAVGAVLEQATGARARLVKGASGRRKTFVLEGIAAEEAATRLLQ